MHIKQGKRLQKVNFSLCIFRRVGMGREGVHGSNFMDKFISKQVTSCLQATEQLACILFWTQGTEM